MTSLDTLELDDDISRPLDIVLDVVVLVVWEARKSLASRFNSWGLPTAASPHYDRNPFNDNATASRF
jgi:hypothetical protein